MKVSIITVSYNSEKTIRDTIKSVLSQKYTNIEYLIVDGGSTDGTVNILKEYEPFFKGRLKWVSEPDKGLYYAINKGINNVTGELVNILNSDDFYIDSEVIELVVKTIKSQNVDSIYSDLYIVDPINTNKIIRNCTYKNFKKGDFFKGWHPPHPSFFVKKKIYDNLGNFDTTFKIAADYDFMLRAFEVNNISSVYLSTHTIKMRNGGLSTYSLKNRLSSQKECLNSFEKYNLKLNKIRYFSYKYVNKLKQYSFKSLIKDLNKK